MTKKTLPSWSSPAERQPGWEVRYAELLEQRMAEPFAWGSNDCCTTWADICEAITGRNPFPASLRTYSTGSGAAKLLLDLGFKDIEEGVAQCLPTITKAKARRGDVGIFKNADGTLVALIIMGATAVGKGPDGPVYVQTRQLKSTYAIGA